MVHRLCLGGMVVGELVYIIPVFAPMAQSDSEYTHAQCH